MKEGPNGPFIFIMTLKLHCKKSHRELKVRDRRRILGNREVEIIEIDYGSEKIIIKYTRGGQPIRVPASDINAEFK